MKGVFSGHSAGMQFLILFLLGLAGAMISSFLGLAFSPMFFEVTYRDIFNGMSGLPPETLKFLQLFASIGTFLLPAMVGAWLFSPRPWEFLGFKKFEKPFAVVPLLILLALSGSSVSDLLYRFSTAIPWPDSLSFLKEFLDHTEALMSEQIRVFLEMDNIWDFAGVFVIMAILPAVGEEFLFRGVVQPLMKRSFRNTHVAVFVTAFLFALLHQQVYAFLSIMALGVVLGYLKEWSGSIWVPVIMHLVNNGAIIIGVYFLGMSYDNESVLGEEANWAVSLVVLLAFVALLLLLYRLLQPSTKAKSPTEEAFL